MDQCQSTLAEEASWRNASCYAQSMHVHGVQVVSNRMQKSILVAVDKWKYIAKYKTRIKRTKKLMVRPLAMDAGFCSFASIPLAGLSIPAPWMLFGTDAGTRRDECLQHW